ARVRRHVLIGLCALTALAIVTSIAAGIGLAHAQREARLAREARRMAGDQFSRSLAASAQGLADSNPYLATALATEALSGDTTPATARDALIRARLALAGTRLVPLGEPIPAPDGLAVAIRSAGDLVAVGRRDGTVILSRLADGAQLAKLSGPRQGAMSAAFTADGNRLVVGGGDGTVWGWDITAAGAGSGGVLARPGSIVWAVATPSVGDTVAVATQAGQVQLLDVRTGALIGDRLQPGIGDLHALRFADNGALLLAGAGNGTVVAYALPDRTIRWSIRAHTSHITDLTVCQQCVPALFVTVSSDGKALPWQLTSGQAVSPGPFDAGGSIPLGVHGASFSPDGTTLTLGGPDGALYSWSSADHQVDRVPVQRDSVTGLATSDDGRTVVSLSDDQTLQGWTRAPRPSPITELGSTAGAGSSIALSPDRQTLALGLVDGGVRLIDPTDGQERGLLTGTGGAVDALAFLPSGQLVTGDDSGALHVWDTAAGRVVAGRPGAHRGAVTSIARFGGRLLSAGADGAVRLWPIDLTAPVAQANLGTPLTDVAADPGGGEVVVTSTTGKVIRWNPAGGSTEQLAGLDDTVWAAALAPASSGGTLLGVARADELLSVSELGKARGSTARWEQGTHTGGALDVAFVDSSMLVTAAGDGRLRFWDAADGSPIGPPIALGQAPLRHLAVGPEGTVWTVDRTGLVHRFDALGVRAACSAMGPEFVARERARLRADHSVPICGANAASGGR
ncbi:MAG: PQQ-binding-like beta-propeller repeat protein, partial [Actinobacteria bacterium]|nr:PQQ-binding-like beta-propeller repeat protein [Actinomycetota bacterium]